ncbi:MAG: hypothetical protein ABIH47_09165 [Candidatus Omnitrophota bacterium]
MRIEVEIDLTKLDRAFRLAPKVLKEELADGFDHISLKFLKQWKAERLQGPPGIKGRPRGIFSHFRRAHLVSPSLDGMGIEIFTDSKIAVLHEQGGTVKGPGGGRLAVPLSAREEMFTRSGALKRKYKKPRELKNVRAVILKGKRFLAKFKKRSREILPLYILKNSVRIKPRLGFYKTWDSMQNVRIRILNNSITKALRRV